MLAETQATTAMTATNASEYAEVSVKIVGAASVLVIMSYGVFLYALKR